MQLLDLTLPLPAENLALDEALLESCEAGEIAGGVLRVWEPQEYFVVLGRSSDPVVEVNLAACRRERIPILRRASGGGTILAGPGCLMYAVILSYVEHPELKAIPRAHQFVLDRITTSLTSSVPGITLAGTSDLAFRRDDTLQKFSGNALRAKRTYLLYHGTLLYNFDLPLVSQLLARPTREPNYRAGRSHKEFIANLPLSRELILEKLIEAWQTHKNLASWPEARVKKLAIEKHASLHG
jgi:lipoate---protein ligase